MKPNGMKVSDCLIISSGSDDSFVHEERVFEFVKRFVGGLNAKQAGAFLKYVTSHEVSKKILSLLFSLMALHILAKWSRVVQML